MSVCYTELVDVHAYVAGGPLHEVMLTLDVASWPNEAKAYADPDTTCAAAHCAAERVLSVECDLSGA